MAWTDLVSDRDPNDQFTADDHNALIDNLNYLAYPPSDLYVPSLAASTITTNSTSMVALTGYSVTVNVERNPGLIMAILSIRASSTNARFDFLIDGVSITGDSDGMGAVTPASTFGANTFVRFIATTPGARVISVNWRVTTGTGIVYPAGLSQLFAEEIGYTS